MAELIKKEDAVRIVESALFDDNDSLTQAITVKCIERLPTVTEAEIRASVIDEFLEKAVHVVYEANNRERNPQPRDMVADIHYKLMDLAEQLKGE